MRQILLYIFVLTIISCNNKAELPQDQTQEKRVTLLKVPKHIKSKITKDTCLQLQFNNKFSSNIYIKIPQDTIKACILMLHGWDLPALQWADSTTFCTIALEKGYALIMPDLKRCNYPLKIYPETKDKYRNFPDLPWIIDQMIPFIKQETGFLDNNHNNFIAGISTGGRGATLLAYYLPETFKACACLSGDFDITSMQDEYLYRAWFGDYKNFKQRWKNECFAYDTKNYLVPSYISHGKQDKVSPYTQSLAMVDSLKANQPTLDISYNFPENHEHNYSFWASESNAILDFFAKHKQN